VHAQSEDLSSIPKIANEWSFELTPYVWLPQISSTLNYKDQYANAANVSMNNVISNLKSGAMIAGEARYGKWGIMADVVSATLQKTGSFSVSPAPGSSFRIADKATFQQTILTGAATYNLLNNPDATVDGLVGVRWIGMTATLNLTDSSAKVTDSQAMNTVDPIAGFKGRYRIANSTWYIPFYADIGGAGGTTNITWQAILGVGITIEKWVDVSLIYRGLYYDMDSSKKMARAYCKRQPFKTHNYRQLLSFKKLNHP